MNMADHLVSMSRGALLDAAFTVLAREPTLRPEPVAREAGCSKALVFHHFGSLQGLHDAMAERVLRETQQGLDALADEYPNPRARLEALARALLSEPPEPPAATRRVLRFWLADDEKGRLRDALVADFVAKTLREMRAHAEPGRVASRLLARWHGATVAYALGGAVDFEGEQELTVREIDALR